MITSRRLRWTAHVAGMEEGRSVFKNVKGTPTRKRPLGRPRRRSEDNFKNNIYKVGINTKNWVDSTQDGDY